MQGFVELPNCDKCGSGNVTLKYINVLETVSHEIWALYPEKEYLKCKCGRCGYNWDMKVKKAKY